MPHGNYLALLSKLALVLFSLSFNHLQNASSAEKLSAKLYNNLQWEEAFEQYLVELRAAHDLAGEYYDKGDYVAAAPYMELLANSGNVHYQNLLANLYLTEKIPAAKDADRPLLLLKESANGGFIEGQDALGAVYYLAGNQQLGLMWRIVALKNKGTNWQEDDVLVHACTLTDCQVIADLADVCISSGYKNCD